MEKDNALYRTPRTEALLYEIRDCMFNLYTNFSGSTQTHWLHITPVLTLAALLFSLEKWKFTPPKHECTAYHSVSCRRVQLMMTRLTLMD